MAKASQQKKRTEKAISATLEKISSSLNKFFDFPVLVDWLESRRAVQISRANFKSMLKLSASSSGDDYSYASKKASFFEMNLRLSSLRIGKRNAFTSTNLEIAEMYMEAAAELSRHLPESETIIKLDRFAP